MDAMAKQQTCFWCLFNFTTFTLHKSCSIQSFILQKYFSFYLDRCKIFIPEKSKERLHLFVCIGIHTLFKYLRILQLPFCTETEAMMSVCGICPILKGFISTNQLYETKYIFVVSDFLIKLYVKQC